MTRRQQTLIATAAASLAAATPLAAESQIASASPTSAVRAAELVVSPLGLDSRAENRAEETYRVLYRRAERHGSERPGRNIVKDGVRDHGRPREATKREIERSVAKLRASLKSSSSEGRGSVRTTKSASGGSEPSTGSASTAGSGLESIAACESGGDPSAVGGGGQYRGKYQFDQSTWSSVGGSGDPAAASESEQDTRAAQLMAQQGSAAWPTCGG
jgi:hypothetical protein